jgi:hypothetical protein
MKNTEPKPAAPAKLDPNDEAGTPEHLGSSQPYAGEASASSRARRYTVCGDPRRWQQRRRKLSAARVEPGHERVLPPAEERELDALASRLAPGDY